MELKTLKEALADWADFDSAGHALMRCLGLLALDYPEPQTYTTLKHVFWSNNDVGNQLYKTLEMLTQLGILQFDEENLRYRWNSDFKGSWEK